MAIRVLVGADFCSGKNDHSASYVKLRCPLLEEGDTTRTLVIMLILLDNVSTKDELAMRFMADGVYRDIA